MQTNCHWKVGYQKQCTCEPNLGAKVESRKGISELRQDNKANVQSVSRRTTNPIHLCNNKSLAVHPRNQNIISTPHKKTCTVSHRMGSGPRNLITSKQTVRLPDLDDEGTALGWANVDRGLSSRDATLASMLLDRSPSQRLGRRPQRSQNIRAGMYLRRLIHIRKRPPRHSSQAWSGGVSYLRKPHLSEYDVQE